MWENEIGGVTYEVGTGGERFFVKWSPAVAGFDLAREAARLAWAGGFIPVPRVLDHDGDQDGEWLVTSALAGDSAVSPRWRAEPATAVRAMGEGLRAMHDRLPAGACPFSWDAAGRVASARRRAAALRRDPGRWIPPHLVLDDAAVLDRAADAPPVDQLVVCHGDACAPNTLLGGDGRWSGHVDLGDLGVADRWADLAVATWSTQWNYGHGWEEALLDAYGVGADPDRIRYYRLLWEMGP